MERESLFPAPPKNINHHDLINFKKHFNDRNIAELDTYGKPNTFDIFNKNKSMLCKPEELNSQKIIKFIKSNGTFDLCIIFGTDIIKNKLLKILPKISMNLHLGISPYFKGSATLFWPSYFLMPQFSGATFHRITENTDAGQILHHSLPELKYGDKLHDIGTKTVLKAANDMKQILNSKLNLDNWKFFDQRNIGGLYLMSDFHPSHLRVIYDQYDNRIVDEYLNGNLLAKEPKIINSLN